MRTRTQQLTLAAVLVALTGPAAAADYEPALPVEEVVL